MSVTQIVRDSPRESNVRWRATGWRRRTAALAGLVGLTAGAGLFIAGSALASAGSQPGNLILKPASGTAKSIPKWSTTDACPTGFQGSAELAEFTTGGTLLSRISPTVSNITSAFSGTLDGTISALLHFAHVRAGGSLKWAVGCWSGPGGTGSVKYVQFTYVTLSSAGSSYSTSSTAAHPASGSASGQPGSSSGNGQQGSGSANGQQASPSMHAESDSATVTRGMSPQVEAALIAAACGIVVASGGIAWHRRRNRSRLL
jgi:hypothetical protein